MRVTKKHSFDIELAEVIGIPEAIIFENICFWIEKNKANGVHFYENRYWTYNSINAFEKLFPYMSRHVINRSLKKLEDLGLVVTGNFNQSSYDRTKWYSNMLVDHCVKNGNGVIENRKSISKESEMDLLNNGNRFVEKRNTIPYSKPYINTDINTDSFSKKTKNSSFDNSSTDLKEENNKRKKTAQKTEKFGKSEFRNALLELGADPQHIEDWFAVRDKHKAPYTVTALSGFVNECNKNNYPVNNAVKNSAENGWRGFKYSWVKNLESNGKGFTNDRQQRAESRQRLGDLADEILRDAGWQD